MYWYNIKIDWDGIKLVCFYDYKYKYEEEKNISAVKCKTAEFPVR